MVLGAAQEDTVSHSPVGCRFTERLGERNSCNLFGSAPRAITEAMLKQPCVGVFLSSKITGSVI